jgi:hypothetical protein|tara:strand:- start:2951 stop:3259 length:309 start_codon:yes stop_codon:yes gene_type:complete
LSHENNATFEQNGKHFVAKTAGFRSMRAATNAELSPKNRKKRKTKFFDSAEEADLESRKRSQRTDSVRQMNSRGDGKLLPVPHNKAMHKLIKKIRESKNNGK